MRPNVPDCYRASCSLLLAPATTIHLAPYSLSHCPLNDGLFTVTIRSNSGRGNVSIALELVSLPSALGSLWGSLVQCRIIIYKKGLQDRIDIKAPSALGGLKSEVYLAMNPQGKMPLLTIPQGDPIPESEVPPSQTPTTHMTLCQLTHQHKYIHSFNSHACHEQLSPGNCVHTASERECGHELTD